MLADDLVTGLPWPTRLVQAVRVLTLDAACQLLHRAISTLERVTDIRT